MAVVQLRFIYYYRHSQDENDLHLRLQTVFHILIIYLDFSYKKWTRKCLTI